MFLRLLPAFAFFALTLPALSDTADQCELTDDQSDCVRILACIGDQGRWFNGRAFGRGAGSLAGEVNDGVTCTGNWVSANAAGYGQADVACDDGMTVTVLYFYQDSYTGTAIGRGLSNRDDQIEAWSGKNVLDYFRDGSPDAKAIMKCGDYGIPIS